MKEALPSSDVLWFLVSSTTGGRRNWVFVPLMMVVHLQLYWTRIMSIIIWSIQAIMKDLLGPL